MKFKAMHVAMMLAASIHIPGVMTFDAFSHVKYVTPARSSVATTENIRPIVK
jgi:hypothetical protein